MFELRSPREQAVPRERRGSFLQEIRRQSRVLVGDSGVEDEEVDAGGVVELDESGGAEFELDRTDEEGSAAFGDDEEESEAEEEAAQRYLGSGEGGGMGTVVG